MSERHRLRKSDLDIVADLSAIDEGDRRRLLMIVNPYATTVSSRLKNLVISALRGSFIVDAVDTERRDHATRSAARPRRRDTTRS